MITYFEFTNNHFNTIIVVVIVRLAHEENRFKDLFMCGMNEKCK